MFMWNDFQSDLFVRISALQKSIRRGLVEDSLHFCNLLLESSIWWKKIVITRMITYLVEDIGFANIWLINNFIDLFDLKGKNIDELNLNDINEQIKNISFEDILKFCLLFAINPKNREIDNALVLSRLDFNERDKSFFQEFDKEILFLNESLFVKQFKLKNTELLSFLGLSLSFVEIIKAKDIKSYYKIYNEKIKEKLLCFIDLNNLNVVEKELIDEFIILTFYFKEILNWKDWILLYYTLFYLWWSYNIKLNIDKQSFDKSYTITKTYLQNIDLSKVDYIKSREIQDYVYDKHTVQGKNLWRWKIHFFKEGAILKNKMIKFNDYYSNLIVQWIEEQENKK